MDDPVPFERKHFPYNSSFRSDRNVSFHFLKERLLQYNSLRILYLAALSFESKEIIFSEEEDILKLKIKMSVILTLCQKLICKVTLPEGQFLKREKMG